MISGESHDIHLLWEENIKLKQVMNEVILANHRFQRYNQERAGHLKNLLNFIESLRKERNELQQSVTNLEQQVLDYKEECNVARDLIDKLNEQIWLLRASRDHGVVLSRGVHPDPNLNH